MALVSPWTSVIPFPCVDDVSAAAFQSNIVAAPRRDVSVVVMQSDVNLQSDVADADVGATVDPSSDANFDFFGHLLAETHWCHCSLSDRASSLKNVHPCSSSTCSYHDIRKVKPFGLLPLPGFSFWIGVDCLWMDCALLKYDSLGADFGLF